MRPIEWLITVALLVTANELDPPDDPVLSVVENGPFKFANLFFLAGKSHKIRASC